MKSCREFRLRLSVALEGRLVDAPLAWHEHLTGCGDCRDLFVAEGALDELLAHLPEPQFPVALGQRILRRLERELDLDRVLDQGLASETLTPEGLAARVLAGVLAQNLGSLADSGSSEGAPEQLTGSFKSLDELLDTQEYPKVPMGLSKRVLDHIADPIRTPILRPTFGRIHRAAAAAAAILLVTGTAWRLMQSDVEKLDPKVPIEVASTEGSQISSVAAPGLQVAQTIEYTVVPDPELLASLDLLEEWDLLVPAEVDLLLGSLDESDTELLLLDAGFLEVAIQDGELDR